MSGLKLERHLNKHIDLEQQIEGLQMKPILQFETFVEFKVLHPLSELFLDPSGTASHDINIPKKNIPEISWDALTLMATLWGEVLFFGLG